MTNHVPKENTGEGEDGLDPRPDPAQPTVQGGGCNEHTEQGRNPKRCIHLFDSLSDAEPVSEDPPHNRCHEEDGRRHDQDRKDDQKAQEDVGKRDQHVFLTLPGCILYG